MGNKTDTILFDLDDTLIVERHSAETSFREAINQTGLNINTEEFLNTIFKQAWEEWHRLPTTDFSSRIKISSWEALWADFTGDTADFLKLRELAANYRFDVWFRTLAKFGIQDEPLAYRLSSDFKRIRNTKHLLYGETTAVLTNLKNNCKLGLITNGAPDLQWKKINGGHLKEYFDFIAISGEHNVAKPDGRLFDIAIKGLKSDKANTVMVGNSLETDIKGGRDFGLKTIWINRTGEVADGLNPDFELTSLTGIEKIITALPNSQ